MRCPPIRSDCNLQSNEPRDNQHDVTLPATYCFTHEVQEKEKKIVKIYCVLREGHIRWTETDKR